MSHVNTVTMFMNQINYLVLAYSSNHRPLEKKIAACFWFFMVSFLYQHHIHAENGEGRGRKNESNRGKPLVKS
jgi:hypothetical protein